MDRIEWGVVGGLTADERKALRRETARAKRKPKPHPCPACDGGADTERGLSIHWSIQHAATTGKCIYGHPYNGKGRCVQCSRRSAAAAYFTTKDAS
jgi:hypothetical protein